MSSGERRRLSIAVGILADPRILFLDEPTSGLDSFAALSVMSHLQGLAHRSGKAVVAAIHQPRSAIWSLFDKVCSRTVTQSLHCMHCKFVLVTRLRGVASRLIRPAPSHPASSISRARCFVGCHCNPSTATMMLCFAGNTSCFRSAGVPWTHCWSGTLADRQPGLLLPARGAWPGVRLGIGSGGSRLQQATGEAIGLAADN